MKEVHLHIGKTESRDGLLEMRALLWGLCHVLAKHGKKVRLIFETSFKGGRYAFQVKAVLLKRLTTM